MMRSLTAADVRGLGEPQTLEIKRALGHRNDGMQALCGMANSNTAIGIVVFGVDPSGAIVGVEERNLDTAPKPDPSSAGCPAACGPPVFSTRC